MDYPVYCPDCKGQIEMTLIKKGVRKFEYPNGCDYEEEEYDVEPYYKCPKCMGEFDPEDLEG